MRAATRTLLSRVATVAAGLTCTLTGALPAQQAGFQPDIAYNASAREHLAVWIEWINLEAASVKAQRFGEAGGARSSEFYLGYPLPTVIWAEKVHVAAVHAGETRWAAVALGGGFVSGGIPMFYAVDGSNRVRSFELLANSYVEFIDVGGEETTVDDEVIVVHNVGRTILAHEVNPDELRVVRSVQLDTGTSKEVVISATGGQPGRYLVVWRRNADLFGAVVDRDLRVLVPRFPIAQTSAFEGDPEVDGDGTDWIVAYEQARSSSDDDIVCRRVTYDARTESVVVSGPVVVQGEVAVNESNPTVVRTDESYQIGYYVPGSPTAQLVVESLEFLSCQPCEGTFTVSNLQGWWPDQDARMAAGADHERGVITWFDVDLGIQAQGFTTDDGEVVDLGGGCGAGGTAAATCAAVGAPAFGIRVQHGAGMAPAWLLLGAATANFACGPCTLVPVPVVALPANLDAHGNAEAAFALPNNAGLRGQSLLAQWLVAAPGGCAAGWSFSNALDITIE